MPLDPAVIQEPSKLHGNGDIPYQCSSRPITVSPWSVDYGYCRTSLDLHDDMHKVGSSDPRCPAGCPNKAPHEVVVEFHRLYSDKNHGNAGAAAFSTQHRSKILD